MAKKTRRAKPKKFRASTDFPFGYNVQPKKPKSGRSGKGRWSKYGGGS